MLLYDRLMRWASTHLYTEEDTRLWRRLAQARGALRHFQITMLRHLDLPRG